MKPYRIKLLDDEFCVFSSACVKNEVPKDEGANTVIINSSLACDFALEVCDKLGNPSSDVIAASISATLFLREKRGLPLTEFSYETRHGNVEVFYTGHTSFLVKPPKCKLSYTNKTTLLGCETLYNDIDVGICARAISVENLEKFDKETLKLLVFSEKMTPSVTLASSYLSGYLSYLCYSDFSRQRVSELSLCTLAAYNEYVASRGKNRSFFASDGKLLIDINTSLIGITLRDE